MNFYIYLRFLISELLVIGAVVITFQAVENRLLAGALAGTAFVVLGFYILVTGLRVKSVRRSASFPVGLVHLFGVALPLLVTRLANHGLAFERVEVLGLAGPQFHRVSTAVYSLLLLATVFDLWRSRRHQEDPAARVL